MIETKSGHCARKMDLSVNLIIAIKILLMVEKF